MTQVMVHSAFRSALGELGDVLQRVREAGGTHTDKQHMLDTYHLFHLALVRHKAVEDTGTFRRLVGLTSLEDEQHVQLDEMSIALRERLLHLDIGDSSAVGQLAGELSTFRNMFVAHLEEEEKHMAQYAAEHPQDSTMLRDYLEAVTEVPHAEASMYKFAFTQTSYHCAVRFVENLFSFPQSPERDRLYVAMAVYMPPCLYRYVCAHLPGARALEEEKSAYPRAGLENTHGWTRLLDGTGRKPKGAVLTQAFIHSAFGKALVDMSKLLQLLVEDFRLHGRLESHCQPLVADVWNVFREASLKHKDVEDTGFFRELCGFDGLEDQEHIILEQWVGDITDAIQRWRVDSQEDLEKLVERVKSFTNMFLGHLEDEESHMERYLLSTPGSDKLLLEDYLQAVFMVDGAEETMYPFAFRYNGYTETAEFVRNLFEFADTEERGRLYTSMVCHMSPPLYRHICEVIPESQQFIQDEQLYREDCLGCGFVF